jgi:hypothetical protein
MTIELSRFEMSHPGHLVVVFGDRNGTYAATAAPLPPGGFSGTVGE